ncbi:MAG: M23 family metallopeptidase [Clostridiales bacterium]|nr:M23 family metallopeptidase [Clostridiales bacterium]
MSEQKKTNNTKILTYYLSLAAAILIIAAITVAVIFAINASRDNVADGGNDTNQDGGNTDGNEDGNQNGDGNENENNNQPTLGENEFIAPIEAVDVLNGYTFHYNETLNSYYLHTGMDFAAEQGTNVLCVLDGTVESITTGDVLNGTQITITHSNGLTTSYSFIDASEDLAVGDSVERGDIIGTVAAPTGKEYKDGAHLHFEVLSQGKSVDPEQYLNINDK